MEITPRILFLQNKWNERLLERKQKDNSHPADKDTLEFLTEIDPTVKKEYTDWLSRVYISGNFRYEDAARIHATLTVYDKYKHRLDVKDRDIGKKKTEQEIWNLIEKFVPSTENEDIGVSLEGREKKRHEKAKAISESDVVDSSISEDWIIATPKTHYAAQWWGKGTRWCTSMEIDEHYINYVESSPLRIFITPSGQKLQAHIGTLIVCDELDTPLDLNNVLSTLPEAALQLLKQDLIGMFRAEDKSFASIFHTVPAILLDMKTKTEIKNVILNKSLNNFYSSESDYSLLMYDRIYSKVLHKLENNNKEYDIGKEKIEGSIAIAKNGKIINQILFEQYLNNEVSYQDMKKFVQSFVDAEDKFFAIKSFEIIIKYWVQTGATSTIIADFMKNIPDDYQTDDLLKSYAEGYAIHRRSKKFITPPERIIKGSILPLMASYHLNKIPVNLIDKKLLLKAINYKTEPDIYEFIKNNDLLRFLNKEELLEFSTREIGKNVLYLDEKYLTKDFVEAYIQRCPYGLNRLDEITKYNKTGNSVVTRELCLFAVKRSVSALSSMPERFLTKEICEYGIEIHPFGIKEIPDKFRDDELYIKSMEKKPENIAHINKYDLMIPYNIFYKAVSEKNNLLSLVPLPYRTVELCEAAIHKYTRDVFYDPYQTQNSDRNFAEISRLRSLEDVAKHIPPNVLKKMPDMIEVINKPYPVKLLSNKYDEFDLIHDFEPLDANDLPPSLPRLFKDAQGNNSYPNHIMELMNDFEDTNSGAMKL